MEEFWKYVTHPFALGFLAGLVITFFVWKSGLSTKRELKREVKRISGEMRDLETHLNTQLKINASGNSAVHEQVDKLKEQNENLRVNLSAMQNKPGRSELRQLHTLENAVRIMRERSVGFASAWEVALRQAESEYEEATGGLRKLVRKVISLPAPAEGSQGAKDEED